MYLTIRSVVAKPAILLLNCFRAHAISDLDPCRDIICTYHSYCKAYTPERYDCICEENCPTFEEQVCGSNGRTFDNLCLLQKDICTRRANYTKYHPGSCTGNFDFSRSYHIDSTHNKGLLFLG